MRQDENGQTGEQVDYIIRLEGEDMKPTDMRCEAKKRNGRCKKDKTFDMESDTWRRWCEDHQEQEKLARVEGGPRVERFE